MRFFPPNDDEIIKGLQRMDGNTPKYEKILYQSCTKYIKGVGVQKCFLSEENARYAYNDALMTVISNIKIGEYVQKAKLSTFIYDIFYKRCVDISRKNTIDTTSLEDEDLRLMSSEAEASELEKEDSRKIILHYIKQLNRNCQIILLLDAYYGFKAVEMVDYVNLANGRVISGTHKRCLEKLAELSLQSNH